MIAKYNSHDANRNLNRCQQPEQVPTTFEDQPLAQTMGTGNRAKQEISVEHEMPSSRVVASLRAKAEKIHERLALAIPAPRIELDFRNAWGLLVATILAAQSTDRTVNMVTPALFYGYPTPGALGAAPQEEIERLVHETGFFRNKARAIRQGDPTIPERLGG